MFPLREHLPTRAQCPHCGLFVTFQPPWPNSKESPCCHTSRRGWSGYGSLGQSESWPAPMVGKESKCPLSAAHWQGSVPGRYLYCPIISSKQPHLVSYDFCSEIRKPRLREIAQDHVHMAGKHSSTCPENLGQSLSSG